MLNLESLELVLKARRSLDVIGVSDDANEVLRTLRRLKREVRSLSSEVDDQLGIAESSKPRKTIPVRAHNRVR